MGALVVIPSSLGQTYVIDRSECTASSALTSPANSVSTSLVTSIGCLPCARRPCSRAGALDHLEACRSQRSLYVHRLTRRPRVPCSGVWARATRGNTPTAQFVPRLGSSASKGEGHCFGEMLDQAGGLLRRFLYARLVPHPGGLM